MRTTGHAEGRRGLQDRIERRRRRRTRRARRIALLVFLTSGALWSFPGGPAAATTGTPVCRPRQHAEVRDYLTGIACPPHGFAETFDYAPQLVATPYGWRYVKPAWAGASCSGPLPDEGPVWDFSTACATHDYGYDLLRFGVQDRDRIDGLFLEDMLASCRIVPLAARPACDALARWGKAGLDIGRTGLWPVRPVEDTTT